MGLLTRAGISYQTMNTTPIKTFDCKTLVRITHKIVASIIVRVIYRPPGHKLEKCSDEPSSILDDIMIKSKDIVILGDFNMDRLKMNSKNPTANLYL